VSDGALVTCSDGATVIIENGTNGIDGINGQDGRNGTDGRDGHDGEAGHDGRNGTNSIQRVIDPCGNTPGIIDEVLLQMADGSFLCYFTANINGDYGRLAVLPPGNYMTTDGSNCHFSITLDSQIQY
jgi:hypothetical protein